LFGKPTRGKPCAIVVLRYLISLVKVDRPIQYGPSLRAELSLFIGLETIKQGGYEIALGFQVYKTYLDDFFGGTQSGSYKASGSGGPLGAYYHVLISNYR